MNAGFRIGRIGGVPITVRVTALFLAGWIAWSWGSSASQQGSARMIEFGLFGALAMMASILLHELGHFAAGRMFKIPVAEVALWGLGGMTRFAAPMPGPLAEAVVSFAGPLVNILIAVVCFAGAGTVAPPEGYVVGLPYILLIALAGMNLLLAILNLMPGPPFDGGGIVRALAWAISKDQRKAQRAAAVTGLATAGFALLIAATGTQLLPMFDTQYLAILAALFLVMGSMPLLTSGRRQPPQGDGTVDPRVQDTAMVMQRAQAIAEELGDVSVGSTHILVSVMQCGREPLASLLYQAGLTSNRLAPYLPRHQRTGAQPAFSVGAQTIYQAALQRGGGPLAIFLAIPETSEAGGLVRRLGLDLPGLKARLLATIGMAPAPSTP